MMLRIWPCRLVKGESTPFQSAICSCRLSQIFGALSIQLESGTESPVPIISSRTRKRMTIARPDSHGGTPRRSMIRASGENISPITTPRKIGARITSA